LGHTFAWHRTLQKPKPLSSDEKKFFSFPFFSPATNLYGYITTESVPPFAVGFLGGLNKKYQCQTVLLRLPLPTGILECSQAHIGNPFIPEYQFSTTHLQ